MYRDSPGLWTPLTSSEWKKQKIKMKEKKKRKKKRRKKTKKQRRKKTKRKRKFCVFCWRRRFSWLWLTRPEVTSEKMPSGVKRGSHKWAGLLGVVVSVERAVVAIPVCIPASFTVVGLLF